MTIAGGIMGALFHRERTGEATTVDVSLLGIGMWAMGQAVALSLRASAMPWTARHRRTGSGQPARRATTRPRTDAVLSFTLPAGRPVLAARCARPSAGRSWSPTRGSPTTRSLMANSRCRRRHPAPRCSLGAPWPSGASGSPTSTASGPWCRTRSRRRSIPQTVANGYVQDCETAAGTPFQLVAAPVQFDEEPAAPARAPEFNEHGDAHPGRARHRLGYHRRPQGPRRRRLITIAIRRQENIT